MFLRGSRYTSELPRTRLHCGSDLSRSSAQDIGAHFALPPCVRTNTRVHIFMRLRFCDHGARILGYLYAFTYLNVIISCFRILRMWNKIAESRDSNDAKSWCTSIIYQLIWNLNNRILFTISVDNIHIYSCSFVFGISLWCKCIFFTDPFFYYFSVLRIVIFSLHNLAVAVKYNEIGSAVNIGILFR